MNKKILYTALGLALSFGAMAQNKNAIKFSAPVNETSAYKHLSILASDEYEGRETGKKGAWMAADYIKKQFKSFGLIGPVKDNAEPFFQAVGISSKVVSKSTLIIGTQTKENLKDYYILPQTVSSDGFDVKTSAIIFAGYGLNKADYNEYADVDVAGKVVMIFATGDPTVKTPTKGGRGGPGSQQEKIKYLIEHKAAGVLVINETVENISPVMRNFLQNGSPSLKKPNSTNVSIPIVTVGTSVANELLAAVNTNLADVKKKISETLKPVTVTIPTCVAFSAKVTETYLKADNVLGYLEGSDPKLKHEVLVITGHYDHIGLVDDPNATDKVNNGADDDGSGTTAVIMLAEAFSKAKKAGHGPKRSILFMTVVGEEKGLWGSDWYSDHPIFPLANTITNLNIDMIGRGDDSRPGDNNFVYIIGSNMLSDELDQIGKKANADYVNIVLDEKYNNRTDPNRFYYRSDHYNFAKHGIPVIFYFNGVHKDYHAPGDEVDKIDFPMLTKRAKLVYYTAWELANAAHRPVVNKNEDGSIKTK